MLKNYLTMMVYEDLFENVPDLNEENLRVNYVIFD